MIEIPSSFHAFFCDHTFSPLLLEGPFRLMTVLVINLAHLAHHKTRNIENRLYFMSGKIFGHYCTLDNEPPHLFFNIFTEFWPSHDGFFCKVYWQDLYFARSDFERTFHYTTRVLNTKEEEEDPSNDESDFESLLNKNEWIISRSFSSQFMA